LKEPKNLRVKIGSTEEVFWTDLKQKLVDSIKSAKREIEINELIIAFADIKIESEQKHLNS